jgi:hypothetical protein
MDIGPTRTETAPTRTDGSDSDRNCTDSDRWQRRAAMHAAGQNMSFVCLQPQDNALRSRSAGRPSPNRVEPRCSACRSACSNRLRAERAMRYAAERQSQPVPRTGGATPTRPKRGLQAGPTPGWARRGDKPVPPAGPSRPCAQRGRAPRPRRRRPGRTRASASQAEALSGGGPGPDSPRARAEPWRTGSSGPRAGGGRLHSRPLAGDVVASALGRPTGGGWPRESIPRPRGRGGSWGVGRERGESDG